MVFAVRPAVVIVAAALLGAGCADAGEPATASGPTAAPTAAPSIASAAPSTVPPVVDVTEAATTAVVEPSEPPTLPTTAGPAPAPPSEPTGAPGIDDPDVFCAAWARAVGIPQLLTIAANFGGLDTVGMARLEVLAAPVVSAAMASLEDTYPSSLEAEREVWFTRVLGPVATRAERAVALLVESGASAEDFARLEEVFLQAVRTRDPSQPVPAVASAGAELDVIVERAATAFDEQLTPWLDDPALIVDDALAPATTEYTRTSCPDLSDLGIGDDI